MYYPERLNDILKKSDNMARYKAFQAIKASEMQEFNRKLSGLMSDIDLKHISDLGAIEKSRQKKIAQIKELELLNSSDAKIVKKIQKIKYDLDIVTKDYVTIAEGIWVDISTGWNAIKSHENIIRSVNRSVVKMIDLYVKRPGKEPIVNLQKLSGLLKTVIDSVSRIQVEGGLQRQNVDADRYIGNTKPKEDFIAFADTLGKSAAEFDSGFPRFSTNELDKMASRAETLVTAIDKMVPILRTFVDKVGHRGDMDEKEFFSSLEPLWRATEDAIAQYQKYGKYFFKNDFITDDYLVLREAYETLIKNSDDLKYMELYSRMQKILAAIASTGEKYKEDLKDVRFFVDSDKKSIVNFMNNHHRTIANVQEMWDRLVQNYPEIIEAAPSKSATDIGRNLRILPEDSSEPPEISYDMLGANELSVRLDAKYTAWYENLIKLAKDLIDFVKLYTKVKSLYPFTVGLRPVRSRAGTDSRGRDIENTKYVEAMNALLNDALSGKSLTTTKTHLIMVAKRLYPKHRKIQAAAKMIAERSR